MNDQHDNTVTTTADDYHSALGKAIHFCRTGRRIPMDIAAELMEQGFNVYELEARYTPR